MKTRKSILSAEDTFPRTKIPNLVGLLSNRVGACAPWVSWRGGSLPVPRLPLVFLSTLAPAQEFFTLRCQCHSLCRGWLWSRWKVDLVVPQLFLLLKIAQEISHTLQNLVLLIGESDEISFHFRNLLSNSSVLWFLLRPSSENLVVVEEHLDLPLKPLQLCSQLSRHLLRQPTVPLNCCHCCFQTLIVCHKRFWVGLGLGLGKTAAYWLSHF